MTGTPNLERIQGKATKNYEIRNPKHEARNKSEIQIFQGSKQGKLSLETGGFEHLDFEHLNLFRISIFDIRI